MKTYFDHEKLNVYQEALKFVKWSSDQINIIQEKTIAKDHLDRSSISILLNIAEGNEKSSIKDRCRYFEIARASAFECVASLDIFKIKNLLSDPIISEGKEQLHKIISILVRLNQSLMNRVSENDIGYYNNEENE